MANNQDNQPKFTSNDLAQAVAEDNARREHNRARKMGGWTQGALASQQTPDQGHVSNPVPEKSEGAVQEPNPIQRNVVDMHGQPQGIPEPHRFSGQNPVTGPEDVSR